jgi:hypothetical protein
MMDLAKMLKDTLLGSDSISTLSKTTGAKQDQVKQVLMDAVPTLIQNMQKNASTKSGEKSLAKALSDHAKDDTGNISDFLKNADLEDGAKILGHILGKNKNVLESGVAKKSGLSSDQVSTILSAAAPLLLNVLGQKKEEQEKSQSGGLLDLLTSALFDDGKGGDDSLGEVLVEGLGSMLVGGKAGKKSSSGGALGSILGSLLGGEAKKPAAKKTTAKKTTAKKSTGTKKSTAKKTTAKKTTTKKTAAKKTTAKGTKK